MNNIRHTFAARNTALQRVSNIATVFIYVSKSVRAKGNATDSSIWKRGSCTCAREIGAHEPHVLCWWGDARHHRRHRSRCNAKQIPKIILSPRKIVSKILSFSQSDKESRYKLVLPSQWEDFLSLMIRKNASLRNNRCKHCDQIDLCLSSEAKNETRHAVSKVIFLKL